MRCRRRAGRASRKATSHKPDRTKPRAGQPQWESAGRSRFSRLFLRCEVWQEATVERFEGAAAKIWACFGGVAMRRSRPNQGRRGTATARSLIAGCSAARRCGRAIEVRPRLDVMMCRSGRRRPAIGRQGRCSA